MVSLRITFVFEVYLTYSFCIAVVRSKVSIELLFQPDWVTANKLVYLVTLLNSKALFPIVNKMDNRTRTLTITLLERLKF